MEKEIIELNQQITLIRGEYMGQRLTLKDYTEMKMEFEIKLYKLNQTLVYLKQEMTPYKSYVEKEVSMLEDLVSFYRKCDGKTQKKILGCIFSEKLHFEDGKAANIFFSKPIQVLISITKVLQGYKKEKEVDKDLLYTYAP